MLRYRGLLAVVLVASSTLAGPTTAQAQSGTHVIAPSLRAALSYQRAPVEVTERSSSTRPGVVVHDITYRVGGSDPVSAYLVTPTVTGPHPAALFLHWLDTPRDSTRQEFLHEAIALASGRRHVVSLLPQLVFPYTHFPVGDARDRTSIVDQAVQLRRGIDLLDDRPDVDQHRVAVVGHDYGAMYASLLGVVDRWRVHALVLMAADATWANWFLTFFLDLPVDQVAAYTAALAPLDPRRALPHEPATLLLQYAADDFFIPATVRAQIFAAAGPAAMTRTYDSDHSLLIPAARDDRDRFLTAALA
jgi:pimeloyl-ACP methyl ester carboxylesterase